MSNYPDNFRGVLPGEDDDDREGEDVVERDAWDDYGNEADWQWDAHIADVLWDAGRDDGEKRT